jgi:hypothetical protein
MFHVSCTLTTAENYSFGFLEGRSAKHQQNNRALSQIVTSAQYTLNLPYSKPVHNS